MVQIVTDSVSDFEPEELVRLNVICVPVFVRFGDKEYRETTELSKDMFFQLLAEKKEFPQTSQPSPYDFMQVFETAMEAGDDMIGIFMSSRFSGIYQGAVMAKELCGYETCHIIDSRNAAGGQRLLVEYAVKLRDQGKTAIEIVQKVEALRSRINLLACPDTLEYLRRGGRISAALAAFGTIAGVKPILHIVESGEVEVVAKVIGRKRGMNYMRQRVKAQRPDPNFPIYVLYSHIRENAQALTDGLREDGYNISECQLINVGAGMGSHIGPNAFGLVYVTVEQG